MIHFVWVNLYVDKSVTDKLLEDTKLLSLEKQVCIFNHSLQTSQINAHCMRSNTQKYSQITAIYDSF